MPTIEIELLSGVPVKSIVPPSKMKKNSTLPRRIDPLTNLGSMGIGVVHFDRALRITYLNPEALNLLGRSQEEIAGKFLKEAIPPGVQDKFLEKIGTALNENTEVSIEEFFPDPINLWLNCRCRPYQDGLIVVIQDITEKKQAEEALKRSYSVLNQAEQMAHLGAWDIEISNPDDMNANPLRWTDEVYRIFGYDPGTVEVTNDLFFERVHPDDRQKVTEAVAQAIVEQRNYSVEHRIVRPDGSVRFILEHADIIFNREGKPLRMIGAVQDITERKHTEEELRKYREHLEELVKDRTAELQDSNRRLKEEIAEREKAEEEKNMVEAQLLQSQKIEALGSFAGGIAHELNNILYPTIINTEILLEEAGAGTASREMLEQNLQSAYRQRDLIKQILSFSRQSIQKFSPIKVAPLLENTLNFIRSFLPKTIEVRSSIDAPHDAVMGDAVQIQQVIVNLCRNAADALESQKGVIELRLRDTRLDSIPAHPEMKAGEYLELSVSDTGKGIQPELMDRIFDPFFTTKGVGKGSGMGLSVVHGILKKHGGAITVRSEEGKGSRFTVYLPLLGQEARARAPENSRPEESRQRILLVDDEDVIISSLQRALARLGYGVTACRDALEALDLFRRDPGAYDLVITDMTMPKMTGLDLGKEIMETRPNIPVILCTGFSDLVDEEGVKDMGFSGLLMKPAGVGELKKAVSQALNGFKEMDITY